MIEKKTLHSYKQKDFASHHRLLANHPRPYFENRKFEIGILTLIKIAIVLGKPISYFFPQSLLKDMFMDVKSEFEHKALNYLGIIDFFGAQEMTLKILEDISDSCEDELDNRNNYLDNYDEQDNME